jgi:hypothetical protein
MPVSSILVALLFLRLTTLREIVTAEQTVYAFYILPLTANTAAFSAGGVVETIR